MKKRLLSGFSPRRFSRLSLAVFGVLALESANGADRFDLLLALAPPAQSRNNTCQSYVLALALSVLDTSSFASPRWSVDDVSHFRRNETLVRAALEREMKKDLKRELKAKDESTRPQWAAVVKQITFGQFRLKQEAFPTMFKMTEYLKDKVPVRSKANPLSPFSLPPRTTIYFTSFTRIGVDSYKGHIASIVGLDSQQLRNPGRAPYLLLINSFVRGDYNECLPEADSKKRWFATTSWTDDYEFRPFPGEKKYILNWIEAVARTRPDPSRAGR